jgi:DNA-binding MarR family transcriptional regulator
VRNEHDHRSFVVRLTDAGRVAHQRAGSLFLPVLEEVNERLGPDLADTHKRLRSLHQALTPGTDT